MKKTLFLSLLVTFTLFFSCTEENIEPEVPIPMVPETTSATFTWQEDNGSTITTDSAFWTSGNWGTGIRAFKGNHFFEINWDAPNDISIGTKVLTIPNGFTYLNPPRTYTCSSNDSLTISANTSNKLSGNTTVNVIGGSITTVSISYANIPFKL